MYGNGVGILVAAATGITVVVLGTATPATVESMTSSATMLSARAVA